MTDKNFYRAFEERHYASREIIKKLRQIYLPFVEPLKNFYQQGKICDIGCGRGEWLELMGDAGWEVYGVDLDDGMLQDCYERGLPVSKGDGVSFLQSLPDESHVVVSAFHVIEHIPFDRLQTLVREALRVLKPGGLLILETPNPENIRVSTCSFYLDPTHTRPVPPLLSSFLTEYYGFFRTKVLRLHELPSLVEAEDIHLIDVLTGVSLDYAIIAQKNAPAELTSQFDAVFEKEYGLTLEVLSAQYETKLEVSRTLHETKIESRLQQVEMALNAIYTSRSWQITAPLRGLSRASMSLAHCIRNMLRKLGIGR